MAISTHGWPDTRVSRLLALERPVVQGPFGGGLSSVALTAAVADAGGLGSFGVHHLDPAQIRDIGHQLHAATRRSFALNLWVSNHDLPESEMTRERFDAAVRRLEPLYDEVGVAAPEYPERFSARFEDQAEAVLQARPAAFSFVFGVPDERVLAAFRDAGVVTLGTATTPDEAVALDEAGIDIVVASGAEAGGHRGAFLAPAEDSLVGTLPLVRIAVEEVHAPVIAAGGIAEARGIVAALALGAEGVQIGTAFLATDESAATAEHKAELLGGGARHTRLTRAFSGRLARGIANPLVERLTATGAIEPYPYQSYLLRSAVKAAWSGQATPLLEHRSAAALYAALTDGTDQLLTDTAVHPFTGSFTADADHSSFQAQLRHMGVGSFRTGFDDVEARLEVDGDEPRLTGRARVDSITITRPQEFRAHVVDGEDFFDAPNHPEITFASRRLRFADDGTVALEGLLMMRGIERPITATGTYVNPVEDIYGGHRAALDLEAVIDRRDWGMTFQAQLPRGGDVLSWNVQLSVHLELIADAD